MKRILLIICMFLILGLVFCGIKYMPALVADFSGVVQKATGDTEHKVSEVCKITNKFENRYRYPIYKTEYYITVNIERLNKDIDIEVDESTYTSLVANSYKQVKYTYFTDKKGEVTLSKDYSLVI